MIINQYTAKEHIDRDHAWVAPVSETESKVKVCPLIANELLDIFWTIVSPSSLSSFFNGRIRTITWNIVTLSYRKMFNLKFNM
jgi:hypothetical protein